MLDFKRSCRNSFIYYGKYHDFDLPVGMQIIRLIGFNDYIAVEYLTEADFNNYMSQSQEETKPAKSKGQMELETALGTVLNKDPLGKYAGMMLKDIFAEHDTYWIEWCLKNMQNKYIRDKVELIKESGLYD